MPTIYKQEGFRFFIPTNDHPPAHIHAVYGGKTIRIDISDLESGPVVLSTYMSKPLARRAAQIASDNQVEFLEAWSRIHG